jgi:2-methylisoborneol synthase
MLLSQLSDLLPAPPVAAARFPLGPTGLGTSAARVNRTERPERGDSAVPELYCPPPARDDPALGEAVNDDLVDWAERVGIYPGQLDRVRSANFGRLMMLAHPDTDDPDRLLAAGKCALAEWATDDHYCDDESAGAAPELLNPRLAIATTSVDPGHPPTRYAPELEQAMRDDPVLVALRSALRHLGRCATPAQVTRLAFEITELFIGYGAEAGWRMAGRMPPVWEYLAARQINSFLPCIALTDAVGGYELSAGEYTQPGVRRAVKAAALASTLVNDLYSMAKDNKGSGVDFNLPDLIAAEDRCSRREGIERAAAVHDELVHAYETEAAALSLTGTPALIRFLAGVWNWLGGNHEWHRTSTRYNPDKGVAR